MTSKVGHSGAYPSRGLAATAGELSQKGRKELLRVSRDCAEGFFFIPSSVGGPSNCNMDFWPRVPASNEVDSGLCLCPLRAQ